MRRRRALFGLVLGLYVLAFPYHPKLHSPNELCRLWQARAIAEFGKLSLNETLQKYGSVGDLSVYNGLYYPSKAPLLAFLAVPIYKVLQAVSGGEVGELSLVFFTRLFLTVLPTLGLLVLVRRFLLAYVSPDVADGVTATYALGSLAFSYSLLFMSHQTTAVLLFLGFYALWRHLRGEWPAKALLLTGAASGATVMAEYTGALGVLGLAAYAGIAVLSSNSSAQEKGRRLFKMALLVVAGAAPFLVGLMAYHASCFNGPLDSGYKHLADAGYQPWHVGGFLGIGLPDPSAFALSFFSPLRGLFTLSPFLALAIPGLVVQWRLTRQSTERPLFWLSALLLAGYTYFTSSFAYESWGWTTGPRHMTPLVVFLLLPIALLLEKLKDLKQRTALGAAAGLCAASVVVTGAVTMVNYIPGDATNALFGLTLPLFKDGYFSPSVLSLFGVPNPWPGGFLVVLLVAAAALTLILLAGPQGLTPALGAVTVAAYLCVLAALPTGHDAQTVSFLKSQWLAPPGQSIR